MQIDISKEVNFIWDIADRLRGAYKSDKYKDVIIPMVILRRFECALSDTKSKVIEIFSNNKNTPTQLLCKSSGYDFYNTSKFDLKELLNDQNHIKANLLSYIDGFSDNVKEILENLEFSKQIEKMHNENCLYGIIQSFSTLDLDPKTVPNHKMGYIFEDLIRRFSENAQAGDHYTGRDIVKLMVDILIFNSDISSDNCVVSVLDQACGTGGMLSVANEAIKEQNPSANVYLYGQEINGESYAICKADMLIKGQSAKNIRKTDTLKSDEFPDEKFHFIIENPPFGVPWGGKKAKDGVEESIKEQSQNGSRYLSKLPAKNDSQLLFMLSALDKIRDDGKIAIIQNGSPLFSGDTLSGESQIRRYLLERDYIDSIIALPTELFYNTGIATYIWILCKQKPENRRGKVALIDASKEFIKLRKAMGNKRNELSKENIEKIFKLYADFEENELCKIFNNREFIYKEYTIKQPMQRSYTINDETIENAISQIVDINRLNELEDKIRNDEGLNKKERKSIEKLRKAKNLADKVQIILTNHKSDKVFLSLDEFSNYAASFLDIKKENGKKDTTTINKIIKSLSKIDKNAQIQRDKDGIIYDDATKDSEIINIDASIDEYMKAEVLPHLPNAKAFDEGKIGAEIPFTRYFYKYQSPKSTDEIKLEFKNLEKEAIELESGLFDE